MKRLAIALLLLVTAACAPETPAPKGPVAIEATPQREGDPAKGYDALVNVGYVSCGVPWTAFSKVSGPAPESERLPGRNALNAELAYSYNSYERNGVRLVSVSCLQCHASHLFGNLTLGLGNPNLDFTFDVAGAAALAGGLIDDPAEKAEWQRWYDRIRFSAPAVKMTTVGVNPADNLAVVLPAHRDQATLEWSNKRRMQVPAHEQPVPVDVPPWWNMAKKTSMFITGFGRGDHSRMMMSASMLCTDSVDEARELDKHFPDIRAYLMSIKPPKYPFAIDAALAAQGKTLFEANCSRCHGMYGESPSYPNVAVPLEMIGTDPRLSAGANELGAPYINWFNGSFYGEISELVYTDGYVAPPLDGVWATAPYLHNASVPNLTMMLDSSSRPKFWTRAFRSELEEFDAKNVGWKYTVFDHGKAEEPDGATKRIIYDTTQLGYANTGHTFGDHLTTEERASVVEYLKTL